MKRPSIIAISLIATGVLTAMLVPMRFAVNVPFWDVLMDSAHVPIFAGTTWALARVISNRVKSRRKAVALAAVVALLGAVMVEVLQGFTGRTPSVGDVELGALGIGLAVAVWMRWVWFGVAWAGFSLWLAFGPVWREGSGLLWRWKNFPVLGDFESGAELRLWLPSGERKLNAKRIEVVEEHATLGRRALRLHLSPGAFPGVRYLAADADWRGHSALVFDTFNTGPAFQFVVRVDDAHSTCGANRANMTVRIEHGASVVRILLADIVVKPKERPLDLGAVRQVVFFEERTAEPHDFDLDHVRLER